MAQSIPKSRLSAWLSLIIFLFVPEAVFAAGLSVAPMFQEVVIGDEPEIHATVTLSNATDTAQTFRAAAYDFGNLDASGGVAFLGATKDLGQAYTLSRWMRLSQETITLAPRESETITVTLLNDAELSPGGHYGAVVFESVETGLAADPNRIAVSQMIASLIFAKKTEGARLGMELGGVEILRDMFSFPSARLRFRNTGNVHLVPRGLVQVTDPAGRETLRGVINEASSLVLPGQERLFPLDLFPVARAWLPGWYSIATSYRYDGREEFETVTERRFLLPLPPLAALAGGLAAWAGWLFLKRRKERRMQMDVPEL